MVLQKERKVDLNNKPNIIFIIITLLLITINTYLVIVFENSSIGYIMGRIFFPLILLVGIFSIFKS